MATGVQSKSIGLIVSYARAAVLVESRGVRYRVTASIASHASGAKIINAVPRARVDPGIFAPVTSTGTQSAPIGNVSVDSTATVLIVGEQSTSIGLITQNAVASVEDVPILELLTTHDGEPLTTHDGEDLYALVAA